MKLVTECYCCFVGVNLGWGCLGVRYLRLGFRVQGSFMIDWAVLLQHGLGYNHSGLFNLYEWPLFRLRDAMRLYIVACLVITWCSIFFEFHSLLIWTDCS